MEILVLVALGILIALLAPVAWALLRGQVGGSSAAVQASLRQEFLTFQSNIHAELSATRQGVEGAKDVISDHAVKTISQIKEIGETLQKLIQQQEEAQRLGRSLKDLLQAPKLRGNFGEAMLEELLHKALPDGIWERQYAIGDGERVDCVVRFREVVVPIDAKFPRDDYLRYMDAESEEEKTTCWKAFETAVKAQITSIKSKYIKPEQGTTDFALMFIPSEGVYYETIAETNYAGHPSVIWQFAQQNQVIPVGPNTFYAFLQVVILSIRNVEIIRSAKKLQEGLAGLERSFGLFYSKYEEIGKGIDRAGEAYRVGTGHIDLFRRRLAGVLQLESFEGVAPQLTEPVEPDQQNGEPG